MFFSGCTHNVNYNDEGICCDGCNQWLHLKCTTLSKPEFKSLAKNVGVLRYCNKCYYCFTCNTEIKSGNSICCDMCNHWFHDHCARIKKSFARLTNNGIVEIVSEVYFPSMIWIIKNL